jgi:uncharacterized protein (TIGR02300 family)
MSITRAQRGTKRTCVACGERFYDLDRNPIVCPACGNVHGPEAFVRQRPLVADLAAAAPAAAAAKPEQDDDDLDLDAVGLGDDDTLIDDGDDLDDDDDGIEDVVGDVDVDGDEEDS